MDQALSLPVPPLPAPWPADGESEQDWILEVGRTRAAHEQWAQEQAAALGGGGAPGAETPLVSAPPDIPVGKVHEVYEGPVRARIYTPVGEGPFPAVILIHGGGWWIGGGESGMSAADAPCRLTCQQLDAVVVNVDYRQAPEHQFPTSLEDCYATTVWAVEHAAELCIDPSRVAVMGPSAGGNLAAAVALLARDRGGPQLCRQVLMVPALDATMTSPSIEENGQGYELTQDYVVGAWELYLGRDGRRDDPLASPLHCTDLAGLPPAHVVVAEFDPLRDDGIRYAEKLELAAVPVVLSRFPMGHSVMTPEVAGDYLGAVLGGLAEAFTEK